MSKLRAELCSWRLLPSRGLCLLLLFLSPSLASLRLSLIVSDSPRPTAPAKGGLGFSFTFDGHGLWAQDKEELQTLPRISSYVTDTAGLLSRAQAQRLNAILAGYAKRKGSQILLVIVPTVKPETIEGYAIRLAEASKAGRTKIDDGVILLLSKEDRQVRIEVGYGLEGSLTDILTHRIIEDIILPFFKQGDFYAGITKGLEAILQVVEGEGLPAAAKLTGQGQKAQGAELLALLAFFALFAWLANHFLGKGIALLVNMGLGLLAGLFFLNSVVLGLALALLASLFVMNPMAFLFLLLAFSGGGRSYAARGGMGGGGFSGGGGGFGGGGASGSW